MTFNHQDVPFPDPLLLEKIPSLLKQEETQQQDNARSLIGQLVGMSSIDDLAITHSGAEAINNVIFGIYLDITRKTGKNHFITTNLQSDPTLQSYMRLEQLGCVVKTIEVGGRGYLELQNFIEAITPRSACLSISFANEFTGVMQPLSEIASLCKERKIFLHVDITSALSSIDCNLEAIQADALTVDGSLIHAPLACGAIFYKGREKFMPLIAADFSPSYLCLSLAEASQKILLNRDYLTTEVCFLKNQFEQEIKRRIPEAQILFEGENRLPHISCVAFPRVFSDALLFKFYQKKLFASVGRDNFQSLSNLLTCCGVSSELSQGAISFAFSRFTQNSEVLRSLDVIEESYRNLLDISLGVFHE